MHAEINISETNSQGNSLNIDSFCLSVSNVCLTGIGQGSDKGLA